MLRQMIETLAARPRVFDALRWTLEGGYAGHHRVIAESLASPPGPVLDIGCGTGVFAGRFRRDEYLGIDISPTYIAAAQRKFPRHRFAVMDARRLDIPDASQSRGFISGILHHLSDDDVAAVLQEMARVVRPDGRIVIWEDIPTQSLLNVVGRTIHALDLGDRIREPAGYRALIAPHLAIRSERLMRSGCMDYAVFECTPLQHPPQVPKTVRVERLD
jgi:SAM-dependent methyltransferase